MARSVAILFFALLPACALSANLRYSEGRHYHERRDVDCHQLDTAAEGDTCKSLAAKWLLPISYFVHLNPGIHCPALVAGQLYCVFGDVMTSASTSSSNSGPTLPSPTTLPSTTIGSTAAASTRSTVTLSPTQTGWLGPTLAAPEPRMPGIVPGCRAYYYVIGGENCWIIGNKEGISFQQMRSWNTEIDSGCKNLPANVYICVRA